MDEVLFRNAQNISTNFDVNIKKEEGVPLLL